MRLCTVNLLLQEARMTMWLCKVNYVAVYSKSVGTGNQDDYEAVYSKSVGTGSQVKSQLCNYFLTCQDYKEFIHTAALALLLYIIFTISTVPNYSTESQISFVLLSSDAGSKVDVVLQVDVVLCIKAMS